LIVRALFTLIIIFLVYRMYQRLFRQKRCVACGKMIFREAAICHYCNTVQDGVELVQAKAEITQAVVSGKRGGRKQGGQQAMLLLVGAMVLIVLGVALAVWLMQSM